MNSGSQLLCTEAKLSRSIVNSCRLVETLGEAQNGMAAVDGNNFKLQER